MAGVVNPTSISFPNTEIKVGELWIFSTPVTPSNATVTYKSYKGDRKSGASIWGRFQKQYGKGKRACSWKSDMY